MNRQRSFNGFVFHNHTVFDQHIQTIPCINALIIVKHGLDHFTFNPQSTFSEFIRKTGLVC